MDSETRALKVIGLYKKANEMHKRYCTLDAEADKCAEKLRINRNELRGVDYTKTQMEELVTLPDSVLADLEAKKKELEKQCKDDEKEFKKKREEADSLWGKRVAVNEMAGFLEDRGPYCPHCGEEIKKLQYREKESQMRP